MKTTLKRKTTRPEKVVREVGVKYRIARQPPRKHVKCRMLTGAELSVLAEKMIAAHEQGDKAETKRLERELINGWYGETCA